MSTTSMRNVRATRGDGATLRAASAPMGSASTVPISVAPNAIWTVNHRSASSVVNPMPAVSGGQNRAAVPGISRQRTEEVIGFRSAPAADSSTISSVTTAYARPRSRRLVHGGLIWSPRLRRRGRRGPLP